MGKTDAMREAIRKNEAEIKELEANLTRVEHARHPVNTADWLNFSGFQWIGEISMGEETTTSVPSDKPSGRKADVHRQIDQLRHQMGIVKQGLLHGKTIHRQNQFLAKNGNEKCCPH